MISQVLDNFTILTFHDSHILNDYQILKFSNPQILRFWTNFDDFQMTNDANSANSFL